MSGNSGTDNNHFIGTTDEADLVFKTNSEEQLRIGADGNLSAFTNIIPDLPVCFTALRKAEKTKTGMKKTVEATASGNLFQVYPNPSTNGLVIIRFNQVPEEGNLTIYNSIGIEIINMKIPKEQSFQIDLSFKTKGVYLFRYYQSNGSRTLCIK